MSIHFQTDAFPILSYQLNYQTRTANAGKHSFLQSIKEKEIRKIIYLTLYQNGFDFLVVTKGIYLYRTSRETGFLVHHNAAYPYIIYFILSAKGMYFLPAQLK